MQKAQSLLFYLALGGSLFCAGVSFAHQFDHIELNEQTLFWASLLGAPWIALFTILAAALWLLLALLRGIFGLFA